MYKRQNHSIEESDYAYDVTAFNNTIRGKSDDVKGKVVFLTFDDGIDPTLTPQVMNILKEYGVHATFFHIGYTITSENGDILKRQITEDMSLPTFDDGIDPTLTPQVMNILKEYGVHATFFHIGYTITSENGDILKRQITEDMSLPTTVLAIISICSIQDVFQIKVKLFLRLTKPMPISKPS